MTRYLGNLTQNTATIASGQTVSDAVDLQGLALCQIQMPAAFTGASISFQSSNDGVTYQQLYNTSNALISITVTAAKNYNIAPTDFAGCRYLKVVSASAEGASRAITLITRDAM